MKNVIKREWVTILIGMVVIGLAILCVVMIGKELNISSNEMAKYAATDDVTDMSQSGLHIINMK